MPVLQTRDRDAVSRRFDTELKKDVVLKLYTQFDIGLLIPGRECKTCTPTLELLHELSDLSSRVKLEIIDYHKNREDATSLGINRIPAIVIENDLSQNIRFFGMPSGFEFTLFLDSIIASTENRSRLKLETRRHLKDLEKNVHIKVFVTPDCNYCPDVARLAHAMAIESPKVTADVIEIREFPDMVSTYKIMRVPKTIINDSVSFTGPVTEETFLEHIQESVNGTSTDENNSGLEVD